MLLPIRCFNTSKNISKDTTLSNFQQKKAIEKLEQIGFIETKLKGVPATLHFKIIENKISSYLKTSFQETSKLDSKKLKTNKNKRIIINNNISLFRDEVFNSDYPKEMLEDFVAYWTVPSKSGKLRHEMEKTWSTAGRLRTWAKRSKEWKPKSTSKIDIQLNEYLKGKKYL